MSRNADPLAAPPKSDAFGSPVLAFLKIVRRTVWHGYFLALALFAIALAARFSLEGLLATGFPFLTFFPAIVLSVFFGGRGPGLLCSLLSLLAAWYWFVTPDKPFSVEYHALLAVGFFAFIALVDVVVINLMTSSLQRLEIEQRHTRSLVLQRTSLFRELQHRVANNHMTIALLLAGQEQRLAHNPEAVDALQTARRRFVLLARIHRMLSDPENINVALESYLQRLCDEFLSASGAEYVVCHVKAPTAKFDGDQTISIALIVLEVVTNSVKHAFGDSKAGTIDIELAEPEPHRHVLTIQDNGCGFAPEQSASADRRLGLGILKGFAEALQGKLTISSPGPARGTLVRVEFPVRG